MYFISSNTEGLEKYLVSICNGLWKDASPSVYLQLSVLGILLSWEGKAY